MKALHLFCFVVGEMLVLLLVVALGAAQNLGDVDPSCFLCGALANEVEGMLAENRTVVEMSGAVQALCDKWVQQRWQPVCAVLAKALVAAEARTFQRFTVARICFEVGMCDKALLSPADPAPIGAYTVNLDLAPTARWTALCSMPHVRRAWNSVVALLNASLPATVVQDAERVGRALNGLLPADRAAEIRGCADALWAHESAPFYGVLTLANLGYELSDSCTSVVARPSHGSQPIHARNLDFADGGFITYTMRNITALVSMTRAGIVVARQVSYIGFVGTLSGQHVGPSPFTVTVNTRFYPHVGSLKALLDEAWYALHHYPGAYTVGDIVRRTVENASSYTDAVRMLSGAPLIADVYLTVSGTQGNEGVVLTRNRTHVVNASALSDTRSFVLVTNYDLDQQPPWFDNRSAAATNALLDLEAAQMVDPAHLSAKVLSLKPVLNLQTTYSLIAVNANSSLAAVTRYCPFPCAE